MDENELPIIVENPEEKKPRESRRKNVVTDPSAPEYYSERAIYWFSVLIFVLFGAVLMAINLWKINKRAAWSVIGFSFIYVVLEGVILSAFDTNTGLSIVFNIIGVLLIDYLYWKPYIGAETKYRAKPVWKPLVVALVLLAVLFIGVIKSGV